MAEVQISIKNVEDKVFREFKAEATKEGMNIGKSLTLAMKLWIQEKQKKSKKSLLDFKPREWGKGTERVSEEIDSWAY